MTNTIAQKISEKAGIPELIPLLAEKLSGSELSSLLMEVFHQRATHIHAGELLQQYRKNRFVQPDNSNVITSLEKELQVLRIFQQQGYNPLELSPVAQFGTCAAVGTVSQHKIISALRNTEVMADATNAIALHIADIRQSGKSAPDELLRYATIHRHIRATQPSGKGYTPHFKVACLVAGGKDTGNYLFEKTTLREQLQLMVQLLNGTFGVKDIEIKVMPRGGYANNFINTLMEHLAALPFNIKLDTSAKANNYYKGLQFKIYIHHEGHAIDIADGGFTDWTQQLTGNKKERCLIAGIGLSLLLKLFPHEKQGDI